jgi:hypothetical protein
MEETMTAGAGPGLVDAAARVLRELLRTPRFKQSLKIVLGSLDPESAPNLVRTLAWEDTDIFLSLLGSLPELANILLLASRELVSQMENFTPEMLDEFLGQVAERLDGEALGETLGGALSLVSRVTSCGDRASAGAKSLAAAVSRGLARARGERGEGREAPLSAEMLDLLGKAARLALEAASVEGSPAEQALLSLGEDLAGAVREHPETARRLVEPLLQAWRSAGEVQ